MTDFADVRKAIAHLKGTLPEEPANPSIQLSFEESLVTRDLANGLLVAYVVDEGDRFTYIQQRDLEEHRIDAQQLHEIGLKNLVDAPPKVQVQPYENIYAVLAGGNFEASLILLDHLWEGPFRQFVKGQYAVAVAARDILAFGDAKSSVVIRELQGLIGRIFPDGDHLISDRIYLRSGGRWHRRPS